MFRKNTKSQTRLIGYSILALASLLGMPAMAAQPIEAAPISLAAVSTTSTNQPDARTLLALSNMYRVGNGVEASPSRAFDYCRRAARLGLAEAQFQLAAMYLESDAVNQSEDEAIKWLERAAAQGHENAKFTYNYLLNNTYYEGC